MDKHRYWSSIINHDLENLAKRNSHFKCTNSVHIGCNDWNTWKLFIAVPKFERSHQIDLEAWKQLNPVKLKIESISKNNLPQNERTSDLLFNVLLLGRSNTSLKSNLIPSSMVGIMINDSIKINHFLSEIFNKTFLKSSFIHDENTHAFGKFGNFAHFLI